MHSIRYLTWVMLREHAGSHARLENLKEQVDGKIIQLSEIDNLLFGEAAIPSILIGYKMKSQVMVSDNLELDEQKMTLGSVTGNVRKQVMEL